MSESVEITQGAGAGNVHIGASGGDTPVLHDQVQQVLDGVPQANRSVNHGRCGLPRALTNALDHGDDPTNANAASVLVRGNTAHDKHNVGVGPCSSCQFLVNHYNINFLTA
jgi:hypothetical protein